MTLSLWKTFSMFVSHFPDRRTGCLLNNVSYEKACDATRSFNIPVDCVADGAGEAVRRPLKSLSSNLFSHFAFSLMAIA